MRYASFLVMGILVGFTSAHADPNVELLKGVLGKFPVVSWQTETGVIGSLEVKADDSGVGWVSSPSEFSVDPLPQVSVLIPKEHAAIYQVGQVVVIEDSVESRRVSIKLTLQDGYYDMDTTVCHDGVCDSYLATVSLGKTAGVAVEAKSFFENLTGSYKILKAGSTVIEKDETLDVDGTSDPAEAAIYAPYCEPGTGQCDLGYISLPWNQLHVFEAVAEIRGEKSYDILVGEGAALKRFRWTEREDGHIVFRNYQYILPSSQKTVVLDHEVSKKGPTS